MYRIYVTELAHQDLDKIIRYIAVELANPTAAGDFLDEVDKCYEEEIKQKGQSLLLFKVYPKAAEKRR